MRKQRDARTDSMGANFSTGVHGRESLYRQYSEVPHFHCALCNTDTVRNRTPVAGCLLAGLNNDHTLYDSLCATEGS